MLDYIQVPGLSLALIMAVFPSGTTSQDGTFPPPIVEQVRLRIAAATDREVMMPVIAGFQQLHPEITAGQSGERVRDNGVRF